MARISDRGTNITASTLYESGSTTAMFPDVPAGEHIVRLICKADAGDTVTVQFRNLTTMYFPGMLWEADPAPAIGLTVTDNRAITKSTSLFQTVRP